MLISDEQEQLLTGVAGQALDVFKQISGNARNRLAQKHIASATTLASVNVLTMSGALQTLDSVADSEREVCGRLAREPAIARVVAEDEAGTRKTYYISRGAPRGPLPDGMQFASYRAPVGRLAALSPGDTLDVLIADRLVSLEVIERAILRPEERAEGWDAPDTVFETDSFGPVTIESLRRLLDRAAAGDDGLDELARLLAGEELSSGILLGRRKRIIAKMELRDQPLLDRAQDEIFRLPLSSRLALLGPPGTGKTTTLIRRLGQKLDGENLDADERELVQEPDALRAEPHGRSWLMFTPTDLLRQYVKEAFAREGIAASDQQIGTWSTRRRELARQSFGVLKTGNGGGPFIIKDAEPGVTAEAMSQTVAWFEDFQNWQTALFWADLSKAAESLAAAAEPDIAKLGERLSGIVRYAAQSGQVTELLALMDPGDEARALGGRLRTESDGRIKSALNTQLKQNRRFVDELAAFMDTLREAGDEADGDELEAEGDDEDEEAPPQTKLAAAIAAYNSALRTQARSHVVGRRAGRGRSSAIAEWLGERGLAQTDRDSVGRSLELQASLRRFAAPVRAYLNGIPRRYGAFRRVRRGERRWYTDHAAGQNVHPLEVDLMLLAILRGGSELLRDRRVQRNAGTQSLGVLDTISSLQRNQVLVDEMTDFSPVQLGCMRALAAASVNSFFCCGDFNQRITSWGTKSEQELRWAIPDIDIRRIAISYRQSRELRDLAQEIAALSGDDASGAELPDFVDNEGVRPSLAVTMTERRVAVEWVAGRIAEIEVATRPRPLPSIAVLVNGEAEVDPVAQALNAILEEHNLRAVACVRGQIIGQDSDVRVFDVQHIKGLEFEAVFFLDIDRLAEQEPDLFDKYLYVGTTRAATYLGLTCQGSLPARMAHLESRFGWDWS